MSHVLLVLVMLLPSSIGVAAAFYMAVHRIDGWGWFLFVALLLAGVFAKGGA